MEEESFSIKMEGAIKDNGKIIKWMDSVDSTMKEENLPMKDSGHKTSSMAQEKFITTILSPSILPLIIKTLTTSKIIGNTTKANSSKIRNKVEEELNCQMGKLLKVIFMKTRFKGLVSSIQLKGKPSKEFGEIRNLSRLSTLDFDSLKFIQLYRLYHHSQQHPDFFLLSSGLRRVVLGPLLAFVPLEDAPGRLCTFDLISVDRVVKAFSTFTASLADVSRNLIPRESAKVFPSSVLTCRLASKSDLLPTNSFTTFQLPYLST